MFKGLQVTLYDIFGYFLPGVIVVLALSILFWTFFWPTSPYVVYTDFSIPVVVIFAFAAYVAGHVAQGVGNLLEKLPSAKQVIDGSLPTTDDLATSLREALVKRFGRGAQELPPREIYQLCDQTLIHHGSLGEREIFSYREGFYRGVCVAMVALAVAFIVRLLRPPIQLWIVDSPIAVTYGPLTFAALLSSMGAWLSFRRYLHFAKLRIYTCLLRFLALSTGAATPKESENPDGQS